MPGGDWFNFNFDNSRGGTGQAGNQYFPVLPNSGGPGSRGPGPGGLIAKGGNSSGFRFDMDPAIQGGGGGAPFAASGPYTHDIGGGMTATSTLNPNFTAGWYDYLQSQFGRGVKGFPGYAGGSLSAGRDPALAQLAKFFQTGQGGPAGMQDLLQMSKTGDPISALPEWQQMVQAMGRNTKENEANLKEQFNFGGGLASSPFGTAMTDFATQTNLDQNALLGQLQTSALESAQGRKLGAEEFLGQGAEDMTKFLQGLDQQSLDRIYQEFIRTSPQYNPLLGYQGQAALTFPPTTQSGSGGGGLGGILGGAGGFAAGLAKLLPAIMAL